LCSEHLNKYMARRPTTARNILKPSSPSYLEVLLTNMDFATRIEAAAEITRVDAEGTTINSVVTAGPGETTAQPAPTDDMKFVTTTYCKARYSVCYSSGITQYPPIKNKGGVALKALELNGMAGLANESEMPLVELDGISGPIAGGYTMIRVIILTEVRVDGKHRCRCTFSCFPYESNPDSFEDEFGKRLGYPGTQAWMPPGQTYGGNTNDLRYTIETRMEGIKIKCHGPCEELATYTNHGDGVQESGVREMLYLIPGRYPPGQGPSMVDGGIALPRAIFRAQLNQDIPSEYGGQTTYLNGISILRPDTYGPNQPTYGEVLGEGFEEFDGAATLSICGDSNYGP